MSKHTPGPWAFGHHGNVALWVGPSHTASPVALVTWDSHADARDEARDNASLIAAAPDLLEALKEILPWHDSHPLEQTDNRIVNLCRAAIARAEGRS